MAPTPWRATVLTGAAVLAPAIAWLAPLGFAPLAILAGLLCVHLWAERPAVLVVPGVLFGLLLAWGVAAATWSPADESLILSGIGDIESRTWLKLILQFALYVPVVLAARELDRAGAERAGTVLAMGATGLACLLLLEGLVGGAIYRNVALAVGEENRPDLMFRHVGTGTYVVAVMYWPAMAVLLRQRRKREMVLLSVGAFVAPLLLDTNAPFLALGASLAVFAAVRRWDRGGPKLLAVAAGLLVAFAPLLVHLLDRAGLAERAAAVAPEAWAARIRIWAFTADRIADKPFLGWGMDAARTFRPDLPVHPHDAALQVWMELGALGAALMALLWVWMFRSAGEALPGDRTMTAAACAGATVYFVVGALAFGVWQEWWLALGAFLIAWTVTAGRVRAAPPPFDPGRETWR